MTPSQKLRSIADSTGLDGIADAIREIAKEIEHNNAPAVRFSQEQIRALAICLESCRVSISEVQRKLQISFNEANDLCQSLVDAGYATGLALAPSLRATPAPAPEQEPVDMVPRAALHEVERERDWYKTRSQTMHEHQNGQVWYWQGDGEDHPETLVNSLPVVIRADQLRELIAKPAQEAGLTDEQKTWAVNQLMEQAQVFASAWSLVGGRHDFGNALEEAEQAKTELRSMVVEALRAKGGK